MTAITGRLSNLLYLQTILYRGAFVSSPTTFVGPVSGGLNTTLTNKPAGPPGKHFTKQQKFGLLSEIAKEGLLARNALKGMTELEIAERDLARAEEASWASDADRDSLARVRAAQEKVDAMRVAEAKKKAMDDARAHWRALVDRAKRH